MQLKFKILPEHKKRYVIIIIGVLFRLLFIIPALLDSSKAIHADSGLYLSLATEISSQFQFSSLLRTPGYPAFIAVTHLLNNPISLTLFFQLVIDTVNILLIYRITKPHFGENAALLASLFYSTNPLAAMYTASILSETFFIFNTLLGFLFLEKYFTTRKWQTLVASAFFVGMSILIRPVGLYLNALMGLYFLLKSRDWRTLFHYLLGVLFLPALWMIHNNITKDAFVFCTAGEVNLFSQHAVHVVAGQTGKSHDEVRSILKERIYAKTEFKPNSTRRWYDNPDFVAYAADTAKSIILSDLKTYTKSHFYGMVRFVFTPGVTTSLVQKYFSNSPIDEYHVDEIETTHFFAFVSSTFLHLWQRMQSFSFFQLLIFFFSVAHVATQLSFVIYSLVKNKPNNAFSAFLLASILWLMFLTGPMGQARFRLPVSPYFAILAATCIATRQSNRGVSQETDTEYAVDNS